MSRVLTVFRKNLFKDKVAIVTGGATGIGRAITEELLTLGCNVVIASRDEEKINNAVADIRKTLQIPSFRILGVPCNIRKEEQVESLISTTLSSFGHLNYLVNNGGGQFMTQISNLSRKGWDAVIETNLTGVFNTCKAAYTQWMEENGGAIVNILMDNYRGCPLMGHSAAARAGTENLTKTLSVEWVENGVRVNAVSPGIIFSETASNNYTVGVFDTVRPYLPTKRLGSPAEVSSAVCFLLSPAASFISGTTIHVDGGSRLYTSQYYIIPDHTKSKLYEGREDLTVED